MMKKKAILILGAGGLGLCAAEMAARAGYEKIAFLDDRYQGEEVFTSSPACPIIGQMKDMEKFRAEYPFALAAVGNNALRMEKMQQLAALGFALPSLVHESAFVSPYAKIGEGCIVRSGAMIEQRTVIEKGALINMGALIDHDCLIGEGAHVHMGCVIRNGAKVERLSMLAPRQVLE